MHPARLSHLKTARDHGFTFTELLVVVAVLAILSLLLLPAVAATRPNSQAFQCLSSLRQLMLGWQMYSADNSGWLAPNGSETSQPSSISDPTAQNGGVNSQWCPGRQDILSELSAAGTPAGLNLGYEWIALGDIYPYVNNPLVYHCPADTSSTSAFGLIYPHVRSRSMNAWLSPIVPSDTVPQPQSFYKESSLINPAPASLFVFIDESPASINDGSFISVPQSSEWVDGPASYHNGAGGLAFADGHAIMRKWTDPVVLNGASVWVPDVPGTPGYADLLYLQNLSSIVAP